MYVLVWIVWLWNEFDERMDERTIVASILLADGVDLQLHVHFVDVLATDQRCPQRWRIKFSMAETQQCEIVDAARINDFHSVMSEFSRQLDRLDTFMSDSVSETVSHNSERNQRTVQFSSFDIDTYYTIWGMDEEKDKETENGN